MQQSFEVFFMYCPPGNYPALRSLLDVEPYVSFEIG